MLFASDGIVEVLGERVGQADVFDLRPRIGLASSALAERVPAEEKVIDLVLTASYAMLGRWTEEYDSNDVTRAVELIDMMGAAHLIRRRFGSLSEGERKRVQIARALMPDPEVLLLDEPAAGLDVGGREDLVRRLAVLADDYRSPALVLVTHHVEEVPIGFTHALLLRHGAVVDPGADRARDDGRQPVADVRGAVDAGPQCRRPLVRQTRTSARRVLPDRY